MSEFAASMPSGPTPVAPKTFGQILDRTYRLVRSHFKLLVGIAAVPSGIIILFMAAILGFMFSEIIPKLAQKPTIPTPFPAYMWAIMIPTELFFYALSALYVPAAIYAATQADLGVTVTFLQSYGLACRRFGRFLWLLILTALFIIVPVAVVAALVGLGALLLHSVAGSSGMIFLIPLLVLLYIAFAVYCVVIMLRFSLSFPACVEEEITSWASLKRSAKLTQGAKGRIFLVMIVIYAGTYVVTLVCMCIFFVLAALVAAAALLAHVSSGSPAFYILIGLGVFGYVLVIAVSMLISYAAYTAALAVLYHDQRLRMDGLLPAPPQITETA